MSDTVKLIIEIPQEIYSDVLTDGVLYIDYVAVLGESIKNGTLLDSVKAEIQESMYCDKDTRLVENANASGLKKALEIIDSFGKGE